MPKKKYLNQFPSSFFPPEATFWFCPSSVSYCFHPSGFHGSCEGQHLPQCALSFLKLQQQLPVVLLGSYHSFLHLLTVLQKMESPVTRNNRMQCRFKKIKPTPSYTVMQRDQFSFCLHLNILLTEDYTLLLNLSELLLIFLLLSLVFKSVPLHVDLLTNRQ